MDQFEPPKYIEKLIGAVNDGAKSAQLGALAFVALGLVLLATAFAATDEDLLLNRSITVSQLGGAQLSVVLSFLIAPGVFLALHLYTLMRYDMLAANIRRFRDDLAVMVPRVADRDRCRQLLANVEFVQALLAPKGTPGASFVFRWAVWFVIAVFPVGVLLLMQLSSLRLQDGVVNGIHHTVILLDLALLGWFAWRLPGRTGWPWANGQRPKVRIVPMVVALAVAGADLAWMRVPGAEEKTVWGRWPFRFVDEEARLFDDRPVIDRPKPPERSVVPTDLAPIDRGPVVLMEELRYFGRVAAYLWHWAVPAARVASQVQPVDLILCAETGFGCRYLTVTDRAIVPKVWEAKALVEMRAGDPVDNRRKAAIDVVVLTGRSLRFAKLSGSQFFAANLNGADLRGADLSGTNFKGASFRDRALLQGANLSGAFLQDANLRGALLGGANLSSASLQGAYLSDATLQDANLSGAFLQGSYLVGASSQGATLTRATLQGATLFGASLQGANLLGASFQGADLRGASLQGANLSRVSLHGADLRGTSMHGASLRRGHLWNVRADESTTISLADLRQVDFEPVSPEALKALADAIPEHARPEFLERMKPRPDADALPKTRTDAEPALVSDPAAPAWRLLAAGQVTDDPGRVAPALAAFQADQVAPVSSGAARTVLFRLPWGERCDPLADALLVPLRERLLQLAASGKVELSANHREWLPDLEPNCRPPQPPTPPASTPPPTEPYFLSLWPWLWGPATLAASP